VSSASYTCSSGGGNPTGFRGLRPGIWIASHGSKLEELAQLGNLQAALDWAQVSRGVAANSFEELGGPAVFRDVVYIPREAWDTAVSGCMELTQLLRHPNDP
jgi:hypothetical protein